MVFFNILFLWTNHVHQLNALPYPVLLWDVWPPSFIIFPQFVFKIPHQLKLIILHYLPFYLLLLVSLCSFLHNPILLSPLYG